jgi:hypothetical protein
MSHRRLRGEYWSTETSHNVMSQNSHQISTDKHSSKDTQSETIRSGRFFLRKQNFKDCLHYHVNTRVYPKVSGLAVWSENCKWYSSEFCHHNLCVASQWVMPKVSVYSITDSVRKPLDTASYIQYTKCGDNDQVCRQKDSTFQGKVFHTLTS